MERRCWWRYRVKTTPARQRVSLHLNAGFTLDTLAISATGASLLVALPGENYTCAAAS
ncbi:hypothetical protein V5H41_29475, partial [Salmonella enterica]